MQSKKTAHLKAPSFVKVKPLAAAQPQNKNLQDYSFVKNRYEPCYTKIKNFDMLKRKRQSVQPAEKPPAPLI